MPPTAGDSLICVCVPAVCPQAELSAHPGLAIQQQGQGSCEGLSKESFQKPQQGPLGKVDVELEVGGNEGREQNFSAPSFSHHIKLCLLNANII